MADQLIESWRINQKMNRILLESINEKWLELRATPRGLTVGEQWAHVSNVRCNWARMKVKELRKDLENIPREDAHDKAKLLNHLELTASIFEKIFEMYGDGIYAKGHIVSITTFYSYMLSHEAHHRGQIILHLKLCDHTLPEEVRYGIWKW